MQPVDTRRLDARVPALYPCGIRFAKRPLEAPGEGFRAQYDQSCLPLAQFRFANTGLCALMSKILDFEIKNYKGIVNTRIELAGRVDSPVVTLIGLNESGKTTILEAISQFVSSDRSVSRLYFFTPANRGKFTFIPASQKGAFTGTVSIGARVELESHELEAIRVVAQDAGYELDVTTLAKSFKIAKEFRFKDNVPRSVGASLAFALKVKTPSEAEYRDYVQPYDENALNLWDKVAEMVSANIPTVAYFPTFLIHVPEQISLSSKSDEGYESRHYREIVERIIKFAGYDIEENINKPIARYRDRHGAGWLNQFYRSDEKASIDAIFQRVSNTLTREVIGGWRKVLSRDTTAKQIKLNWSVESAEQPCATVSFVVSNGDSDYKIVERSIGFRWFFTFLLLTGFKLGGVQRQKIYIFDEPAANLHSRAQTELLSYFEKMSDRGDKIIYSTHSHHMVNPKWLSGAYIIENGANKNADDDAYDLDFTPAEINAVKYKEFISKYPRRSHYFQPVIDRLQYIVPEIIGTSPCVIVEGILDYYALKAASLKYKGKLGFDIIPGVGSSSAGDLISLMMGRGENFIVLLDDDAAGREARDSYNEKWILPGDVIFTLKDVDASFEKMALEKLLGDESKQIAKDSLGLSALPDKKRYGLILAEYYYKPDADVEIFSRSAMDNLQKILAFLAGRFKPLLGKD